MSGTGSTDERCPECGERKALGCKQSCSLHRAQSHREVPEEANSADRMQATRRSAADRQGRNTADQPQATKRSANRQGRRNNNRGKRSTSRPLHRGQTTLRTHILDDQDRSDLFEHNEHSEDYPDYDQGQYHNDSGYERFAHDEHSEEDHHDEHAADDDDDVVDMTEFGVTKKKSQRPTKFKNAAYSLVEILYHKTGDVRSYDATIFHPKIRLNVYGWAYLCLLKRWSYYDIIAFGQPGPMTRSFTSYIEGLNILQPAKIRQLEHIFMASMTSFMLAYELPSDEVVFLLQCHATLVVDMIQHEKFSVITKQSSYAAAQHARVTDQYKALGIRSRDLPRKDRFFHRDGFGRSNNNNNFNNNKNRRNGSGKKFTNRN